MTPEELVEWLRESSTCKPEFGAICLSCQMKLEAADLIESLQNQQKQDGSI